MANYYNVTGYRNTGFNEKNLPLDRTVLSKPEFTQSGKYFQMKGLSLKRDDIMGLNYIDLQGSVKDLRADYKYSPDTTGSQGPEGPYYDWENVDYLRLSRTGYPGDEDFVHITDMNRPYDSYGSSGNNIEVGYYFVTGLQPRARNVTRLFLKLDIWTTLGGKEKIKFTNGFKIRGHITEKEDKTTINMAPELISPLQPVIVKDKTDIKATAGITDTTTFYVSSINLDKFAENDNVIKGISIKADGVVRDAKALIPVTMPTFFNTDYDGRTRVFFMEGIGIYNAKNEKVRYAIGLLHSLGLEPVMDAYRINSGYLLSDGGSSSGERGHIVSMTNTPEIINNTTESPINGTYPRKANYLFAKEILFSKATGAMNIQNSVNLSDRRIRVWANLLPGGLPKARFLGIKDHSFLEDQVVNGSVWKTQSVVLQGAAGAFWNSINASFQQQNIDRSRDQAELNNFVNDIKAETGAFRQATNAASNIVSGNFFGLLNSGTDIVDYSTDVAAEKYARTFTESKINQDQSELNVAVSRQNLVTPTISIPPTLDASVYSDNSFGVYTVNATDADIERLRTYFLRYGYNGLLKPLTWENVVVKNKVNYVKTENASVMTEEFPQRITSQVSEILNNGVFLWSEKPKQEAFNTNKDL